MSRTEFATYRVEAPAKPAAAPPVPLPPTATNPLPSDIELPKVLRILLVEADQARAEGIAMQLRDIFGERSSREWVDDPEQAVAFMQKNAHDIYLLGDDGAAGSTAEMVRSSILAGCSGPIIVLSGNSDAQSDLSAVIAGAADTISLDDLTPGLLERSIRHSLFRHRDKARSRNEIEALTIEKTRLNLLREANHRFVENACHDFRSPLTVIKEFAAIIAEGMSGEINEEQAEFLQIILTRVDHLSSMVDGILDASRLESDVIGVRREEHAVAKLIDQAKTTIEQRAAAHKVKIEFAIPDSLPNVFADAESIGRVIVNLGTNACKYAGENGKIRIWARYNTEDRNVTIGVTDSGPGIAPEHVKLIFDRFQQLPQDKGKDGFGLGLHIASELVRVNFGTLSVESEPQKGSTFAFTLPTFDVNALIPLHFSFLKTSRHGFQKVSIAMASVPAGAGSAVLAEIERGLTRQLRSYDLLLRVRDGHWLVCAAGDTGDLQKITERILGNFAEISRNRPEGGLPEMKIRPIGTWMLSGRTEGLTDAIRGAYALAPERKGIH
jgi:signal transduction histidine kinase